MLKVENAETSAAIIQDEIRRNPEARYEHRLHAVLLVSQGMSCVHVARLMGDVRLRDGSNRSIKKVFPRCLTGRYREDQAGLRRICWKK